MKHGLKWLNAQAKAGKRKVLYSYGRVPRTLFMWQRFLSGTGHAAWFGQLI